MTKWQVVITCRSTRKSIKFRFITHNFGSVYSQLQKELQRRTLMPSDSKLPPFIDDQNQEMIIDEEKHTIQLIWNRCPQLNKFGEIQTLSAAALLGVASVATAYYNKDQILQYLRAHTVSAEPEAVLEKGHIEHEIKEVEKTPSIVKIVPTSEPRVSQVSENVNQCMADFASLVLTTPFPRKFQTEAQLWDGTFEEKQVTIKLSNDASSVAVECHIYDRTKDLTYVVRKLLCFTCSNWPIEQKKLMEGRSSQESQQLAELEGDKMHVLVTSKSEGSRFTAFFEEDANYRNLPSSKRREIDLTVGLQVGLTIAELWKKGIQHNDMRTEYMTLAKLAMPEHLMNYKVTIRSFGIATESTLLAGSPSGHKVDWFRFSGSYVDLLDSKGHGRFSKYFQTHIVAQFEPWANGEEKDEDAFFGRIKQQFETIIALNSIPLPSFSSTIKDNRQLFALPGVNDTRTALLFSERMIKASTIFQFRESEAVKVQFDASSKPSGLRVIYNTVLHSHEFYLGRVRVFDLFDLRHGLKARASLRIYDTTSHTLPTVINYLRMISRATTGGLRLTTQIGWEPVIKINGNNFMNAAYLLRAVRGLPNAQLSIFGEFDLEIDDEDMEDFNDFRKILIQNNVSEQDIYDGKVGMFPYVTNANLAMELT
jgi:hypothetical protein